MTFAWRPGSRCDVATRGADTVLASDSRAQFGRPSTRRGCRICVTVRLPVRPRRETMYWQANVGPATTQNLVVKFDGEICGGVLVENASDFPQQKKLENLLPNFAGSSPPISPKTSPTSLWKSLVLTYAPKICHIMRGCMA